MVLVSTVSVEPSPTMVHRYFTHVAFVHQFRLITPRHTLNADRTFEPVCGKQVLPKTLLAS